MASKLPKMADGMIPEGEDVCMLAQKIDPEGSYRWPLASEPKLDGSRGIMIFDQFGKPTAYSRRRFIFPEIQLVKIFEELSVFGFRNIVLDGEFWAGDWNKTTSIVKTRKRRHPNFEALRYCVFDFLSLQGYLEGLEGIPYADRKKKLGSYFGNNTTQNKVVPVPYKQVEDFSDAYEVFDNAFLKGFEGIVLKELDSPYVRRRVHSWLKLKAEDTLDGKILDGNIGSNRLESRSIDTIDLNKVIEAETKWFIPEKYCLSRTIAANKIKNVPALGAFYIEIIGRPDIKAHAGGGFTDYERMVFWHALKWLIGKCVEVRVQKDPEKCKVSDTRSIRFVRLRFDK